MDTILKQPYFNTLKYYADIIYVVTWNQLHKKEILIPLSGLGFIYFVFLRRIGFDSRKKFKTVELSSENEEYKGLEEPPLNPHSPTITGWLFVKVYKRIQTSLFGKLLIDMIKKKFRIKMFKNIVIPDAATFYPIVRKYDESLNKNKHIDDDGLWKMLQTTTDGDDQFKFISISDLVQGYRNGTFTPVDIAKRIIKGLKELQQREPTLNCIIEYYEDQILKQAAASCKRWKENKPLSIFDGIPIGIKDEFIVGDHHCRNGLPVTWHDTKRTIDEEQGLVKRLRRGGAIIVGVTNMHQIGIGVFGINQSKYHGTSRNPYNTKYSTGGSSGGSAGAVASGLCAIALGTDGGGSIRLPAAFCGGVGLKATYERYSGHGLSYNTNTVGHAGPLCSNVRDVALAYGFLAGEDEDFPSDFTQPPVFVGDFENSDLTGFRIGVDWEWLDAAHPDIKAECVRTLDILEKEHNAEIVTVRFPEKLEMYRAHSLTILAEMAATSNQLFHQCYDELNVDVQTSLTAGRDVDAQDYIQCAKQRTRSMNFMKYLFKNVDVILTPGFNQFQPLITKSVEQYGYSNLPLTASIVKIAAAGNLTGIPCMTQPVGYTSENLPISVQLMASWWREDLLLRVGFAIERKLKIQKPEVYYSLMQ